MKCTHSILLLGIVLLFAQHAHGQSEDIAKTLGTLGERHDLRLGSEKGAPVSRYSFCVTISSPGLAGVTLRVQQHENQIAMLATTGEGIAEFYANDSFVVKPDTGHAGDILLARNARFSLVCEGDASQSSLKFNISLDAGDPSRILMDLSSVIRSILPSAKRVGKDNDSCEIFVESPAGKVRITLADSTLSDFPIHRFAIEAHNGLSIVFSDVKLRDSAEQDLIGLKPDGFGVLPRVREMQKWSALAGDKLQQTFLSKAAAENKEITEAARAVMAAVSTSIKSSTPTTRPDSDRETRGKALLTGMERAILLQTQTMDHLYLAKQQVVEVDMLVQRRRDQTVSVIGDYTAGRMSGAVTLKTVIQSSCLTNELKVILNDAQWQVYVAKLAAARAKRQNDDPIRNLFATVLLAASKENLSSIQKRDVSLLLLEIADGSDAIKAGLLMGESTPSQIRNQTGELISRLVDGLEGILTAEQFQRISEATMTFVQTH